MWQPESLMFFNFIGEFLNCHFYGFCTRTVSIGACPNYLCNTKSYLIYQQPCDFSRFTSRVVQCDPNRYSKFIADVKHIFKSF